MRERCGQAHRFTGRRANSFSHFRIGLMPALVAVFVAALPVWAQQTRVVNRSFHDAVVAGDRERVEFLLNAGEDINRREPRGLGLSPLHLALVNGRDEMAQVLIERGADVNKPRVEGIRPLHDMAKIGNTEWCRKLLEAGADLSQTTNPKWTAMHYAASRGHHDTVRFLHEAGGQLDALTYAGLTPLHLSFQLKSPKMASLLVELGANVTIADRDGVSPFEKACAMNALPLVEAIYDRLATQPEEYRQEMLARGLYQAYLRGSTELAEFTMARGGDPEEAVGSRYSPLHVAADLGQVEFVELLLDAGADVNARTRMAGWTPLHFACANAQEDTLKLLCEKGADPNARDAANRTPVHLAAWRGNIRHLRILIEHGADTASQDLEGNTPLHYAAAEGKILLIRLLAQSSGALGVRNYSGRAPIDMAAASDRPSVVDLLEELAEGDTANQRAEPYLERMELLAFQRIRESVDFRRRQLAWMRRTAAKGSRDFQNRLPRSLQHGDTLLHLAVEYESNQAARMLLRNDESSVLKRDAYGYLAIHRAADRGRTELVALLVQYGSPLDDRENAAQWTPLHFAASAGHVETVEVLLNAGAHMDLMDGNGRLPSAVAAIQSQLAVLRVLSTHRAAATGSS